MAVSLAPPGNLSGTGPVEWVHKFIPPRTLVAAVETVIEGTVGSRSAVCAPSRGK